MLKLTLAFFISMANIRLYGAYLIPIDLVFNKNPVDVNNKKVLLSSMYSKPVQLVVPFHQKDESRHNTDDPLLGIPVFLEMVNEGNLKHQNLQYIQSMK